MSGVFKIHQLSALATILVAVSSVPFAWGSQNHYEFLVLKSSTSWIGEAQINNAGKVVFLTGSAIYAGDERGVSAIATANASNPGIQESLVDVSAGHVSINDRGAVAFIGVTNNAQWVLYVLGRQGWKKVYQGSGETLTDPTINNAGDVLVQFGRPDHEGFYRIRNGNVASVVETPFIEGDSTFVGLANENDLNTRGQFLFQVEEEGGSSRVLFLDDRGVRTIVGGDGAFTLNNAGFIAIANQSGVTIISPARNLERFITNEPMESVAIADSAFVAYSDGSTLRFSERCDRQDGEITESTLLSVGDEIDGSTVNNIQLHRRSVNPAGEIVFTVTLDDGRFAVVLAKR